MPLPAVPSSRAILLAACVIAAAILIFAAVWSGKLNKVFNSITTGPEVIEPAQLEPLQGVLLERIKFKVGQDLAPELLSSTLPVSTTYTIMPFAHATANSPEEQYRNQNTEFAAGATHAETVLAPAAGAYLVKFSNSQLCKNDICPWVLIAGSPEDKQPQNTIFQLNARHVWVSSKRSNGNPDLIVDYGNGMPPVRMVWSEEGQYPDYQTVPPSASEPIRLPE